MKTFCRENNFAKKILKKIKKVQIFGVFAFFLLFFQFFCEWFFAAVLSCEKMNSDVFCDNFFIFLQLKFFFEIFRQNLTWGKRNYYNIYIWDFRAKNLRIANIKCGGRHEEVCNNFDQCFHNLWGVVAFGVQRKSFFVCRCTKSCHFHKR